VTVRNYRRMLSLPLHPMLTDRDLDDVITAVLDIVMRFAR
jgi:dTDP-4-amino-4,6-dideoxygalactose transaminase